jgi:hypothetical protein
MTLDEYTKEEIFATWFAKEEFDAIKQKIITLVRKVERDGAQIGTNKKYCIRGLEALMSERAEAKAQARRSVSTAVLLEQDKQDLDNRSLQDDEAIAAASARASMASQRLAMVAGKRDQIEAQKVYRS